MQYGLPLAARNLHTVCGGQSPAYWDSRVSTRTHSGITPAREEREVRTTHWEVTSHSFLPWAPLWGIVAQAKVAGLHWLLLVGLARAVATRARTRVNFILKISCVVKVDVGADQVV